MESVEAFVDGSERLTSIFGYWPSFHDAEVLDFQLWRGDVAPEESRYIFPILTLKMHCFEMTKEVTPEGFFVLRNHTLVTFKFYDVGDVQMRGFNHQNAIFGLSINRLERSQRPSPYYFVGLEPAFGIEATFNCLRIEVSAAVPCGNDGRIA
jgi:hypothetical protein